MSATSELITMALFSAAGFPLGWLLGRWHRIRQARGRIPHIRFIGQRVGGTAQPEQIVYVAVRLKADTWKAARAYVQCVLQRSEISAVESDTEPFHAHCDVQRSAR